MVYTCAFVTDDSLLQKMLSCRLMSAVILLRVQWYQKMEVQMSDCLWTTAVLHRLTAVLMHRQYQLISLHLLSLIHHSLPNPIAIFHFLRVDTVPWQLTISHSLQCSVHRPTWTPMSVQSLVKLLRTVRCGSPTFLLRLNLLHSRMSCNISYSSSSCKVK